MKPNKPRGSYRDRITLQERNRILKILEDQKKWYNFIKGETKQEKCIRELILNLLEDLKSEISDDKC